jgi:N-acetylglucosaminyldiphosphoundecaprenol N-acetyl-beta-D-mannosaminyltransferase
LSSNHRQWDKVQFLSYDVDSLEMGEAVLKLEGFIRSRQFHQIVPINASKLWQMEHNKKLERIMREASMVIPEYAVVWGARKLGTPLKGHIGGVMLFLEILPIANEKGYKVYFLGATQAVLDKMLQNVSRDFPNLRVVGSHHGYLDEESEKEVLATIQQLRPDMLFVALGTPRQEYWISDHQDELPVPVCMGVGGSFDVLSGTKKDAPAWTRRGGEWIYRLIQDPLNWNLWKRYLITNPWFIYRVYKTKLAARTSKEKL